ncbi:hypothetical protein [Reichenbachiella agariperforans]|uniref:hypothetical protein n=1 Tax=Reichenbachiella agariperforans TaxID=156994 RepID=UPI001C0840DC|nr:hypothetical protein [Reichenbachiella agariperforans]MBU2913804.1 hypothetical protein [Reichenbachiella agariperforans]
MSESQEFLKYLINETLYQIDPVEMSSAVNEVAATESPIQQPSASKVEAVPQVSDPKPTYQAPINKVLILFENPNGEEMLAVQKDYLTKILGAVKLTWDGVDSRNVRTFPLEQPPVHQYVIAFTAAHELGVLSPYQMGVKGNQKVVMAHDLSTIAASVEYRKQLWSALQQMFL